MKTDKKIIIGLIIAIIALLVLLRFKTLDKREAEQLINSMEDQLKFSEDENNRQTATIQILVANKEKDLLKLKTKDSTINWLQSTVRDYKGKLNTAIVVGNKTQSKGNTETIIIIDTVEVEGERKPLQYYETKWANQWEEGYILARPDSIIRDIKVKNEYEITLGNISNGWFKKKEYSVQVLNLNPNTKTKELRSFQVQDKPKKITIGFQAGYGINLINLQPAPYIGIGVQYNIIGIK